MSPDRNYQYMKMIALALLTYISKASSARQTFSFTIADTGRWQAANDYL